MRYETLRFDRQVAAMKKTEIASRILWGTLLRNTGEFKKSSVSIYLGETGSAHRRLIASAHDCPIPDSGIRRAEPSGLAIRESVSQPARRCISWLKYM